ncbi:MAG: carboxymuconolactone decarboxylase family protein [Cyanobacteriota bacterium]|nr:carboxymuconolactone decarboxylase family protein [Cyanobacteriota bacterium]
MDSSLTVTQIFDQIEQELGAGMVPRIFRLLEPYPDLLTHIWGQFRTTVLQGSLPRILKEMMGLVVATATHCEYVRVVHLHSLMLQGVEDRVLEAVKQGHYQAEGLSRLTQQALQVAVLAVKTRAAYDWEDGWQDWRSKVSESLTTIDLEAEEKLELVATIALFEQICTVANLLQLDPQYP